MEKQKIPFKKFLPGIAWFFIVAVLTLMPGSDIPKVGWLDAIPNFDKVVHAGLFGGIAFFFYLPYFKTSFSHRAKINYLIKLSVAVIVWGITVEFIQKFFIPGRDFELLDWAADSAGVVIVFWFCVRILKYFEKRQVR
jgi:VanZ family protein